MDTEEHHPRCIGFIMDGNRRWAKAKELDSAEGHKKGGEAFSDVIRWTRDREISHAVFYAFSSENWNRSETEVAYLMKLALEHAKKMKEQLVRESEGETKKLGVRFRVIGDTTRLSTELRDLITEIEAVSEIHTTTTIWIAFSYGGRAEIISAVNKAVEEGEPVDEDTFRSLMWSSGMPDPDLIVRTGGQQRLSNFLTWQSAYSEFVFLEKYWPDITADDLDTLVDEYTERNRTFGK